MNVEELARQYGHEMKLYGMSQYNENMNYRDTTRTLMNNPDFINLSGATQQAILDYGNNMKRYGMGMYQENGASAEYYNRLGGTPPSFRAPAEPRAESKPAQNTEAIKETAKKLAFKYGEEMKRYGMSQYNERMDFEDTTDSLREKDEFVALPQAVQQAILEYGNNMKRYGMGMYQERGACADYYDKLGGAPPDFVMPSLKTTLE